MIIMFVRTYSPSWEMPFQKLYFSNYQSELEQSSSRSVASLCNQSDCSLGMGCAKATLFF